jgi:hypothetical protein
VYALPNVTVIVTVTLHSGTRKKKFKMNIIKNTISQIQLGDADWSRKNFLLQMVKMAEFANVILTVHNLYWNLDISSKVLY